MGSHVQCACEGVRNDYEIYNAHVHVPINIMWVCAFLLRQHVEYYNIHKIHLYMYMYMYIYMHAHGEKTLQGSEYKLSRKLK